MSTSPLRAYAATLRAYERDLNAKHEQAAAEAATRNAEDWRGRLTPLETRLAKILSEIPDAVKSEGLSLHTLQQYVKGRWRGCAHPGELGAALRHLRWYRTRQWRGNGTGFRALWYPPPTSEGQ